MPRRDPYQYTSLACVPQLAAEPSARDPRVRDILKLNIQYSAHVDADFGSIDKLKKALELYLEQYISTHPGCNLAFEIRNFAPHDDQYYFEVEMTGKKPNSTVPAAINSAVLKDLAYALSGAGYLPDDARKLIYGYGEGIYQPSPHKRIIALPTAPAAAAQAAPAASQSAILTGSVLAGGRPSPALAVTSVPYLKCTPRFTNGMLHLDYHFAGAASDPHVQNCERQLRGIVNTAVQQSNSMLSSPIRAAIGGPYQQQGNTAYVSVRFDRGPSNVMTPLQIHELISIADRLQANGALQAADHTAVIGSAGPAAPQANAPSVIVPANVPGVLGYTKFDCAMTNGALCLDYDLPGSILHGPVNMQIAWLTNAIAQVNQKISPNSVMGSVAPANPMNNHTIARVSIRFASTSANKHVLSQRDIADIANELKVLNMLQPGDHSKLLQVLSNSSFAARVTAGRAVGGTGQAAGATPGKP